MWKYKFWNGQILILIQMLNEHLLTILINSLINEETSKILNLI